MNERWSLTPIYADFAAWQEDFEALRRRCGEAKELLTTLDRRPPLDAVRAYLAAAEDLHTRAEKLGVYAALRQAADTGDAEARSAQEKLMALISELAGPSAAAELHVASLDLEALIPQDPLLTEYAYLLRKLRKNARYRLRPREEEIFSRMSLSGADAWEQLWQTLTSKVPVPCGGRTETLSSVRNLAYSPDAAVRKSAYEAELAAYPAIADGGAAALNAIKLQTLSECRLRGYASPLDRSLRQSHMRQETLDALFGALEASLPMFWDYLKAKSAALGHPGGLPFYDLFAPMGGADRSYTTEEARDSLLAVFGTFDPELHDMMDRAFRDGWIDFFPRPGKVGGAFCEEVCAIRQSRVLTNFGGQFGDLVTLAHELGHAFQNEQLFAHRPLNFDLPMPLAETASTFNENVFVSAAIRSAAGPAEKLSMIESQLQDACQVICDIYSRFLFERSVFEHREAEYLSPEALCAEMLQAQRTAYGDGLDQSLLHPYMWLCKGHYYSGSLSYYNFPYAFGGLFARSLYAMYLEEGPSFVPKYKALLRASTVMDAEDAAALCGADLTSREFWEMGLRSYAAEIAEYKKLLK